MDGLLKTRQRKMIPCYSADCKPDSHCISRGVSLWPVTDCQRETAQPAKQQTKQLATRKSWGEQLSELLAEKLRNRVRNCATVATVCVNSAHGAQPGKLPGEKELEKG